MLNIIKIFKGTEYQDKYTTEEIGQMEFTEIYLENAGLDIYDTELGDTTFDSEEEHLAAIFDHVRSGGRIDIKR